MIRDIKVTDILDLKISDEEKKRLIKLWLTSNAVDLRIKDPSRKWWHPRTLIKELIQDFKDAGRGLITYTNGAGKSRKETQ